MGMKLIVCLGNPGSEYERHRHNVGFRFGDYLIQEFGFQASGKKFKSQVFEGQIRAEKCVLLKPTTFMNCSGEALVAAASFYKVLPMHMVVVYDDFDIPFGELRFRQNGSAGTHNGMKSIVKLSGSTEIPRLRIGIGPLPEKMSIVDFVLSNFLSEEETKLPDIFSDATHLLLQRAFMQV